MMSQRSRRPCPNPLFEKWITEWRDHAASKHMKTKYVYDKALASLRKYPLVLRSGKEANMLKYFGDKICEMLDTKLAEHRKGENLSDLTCSTIAASCSTPSPDIPHVAKRVTKRKVPEITASCDAAATKRTRQYIPAKGSGPYALLLTLHKSRENAEGPPFMRREELIAAAQSLSEKSFTIPNPGCHYTAWSSMGSLIKKGLVSKEGSLARYYLTDAGEELALKLLGAKGNGPVATETLPIGARSTFGSPSTSTSGQTCAPSASQSLSVSSGARSTFGSQSTSTSGQTCAPSASQSLSVSSAISQRFMGSSSLGSGCWKFELRPGQFEIVLVVDNCETAQGGQNERKKAVQTELRQNGVCFDVRKLNVGDFMWIAREKVLPVAGQLQLPHAREIALDFIVERKRKDDLARSILDGRFKEQKYRLKNCGLRRPIYLVEEYGKRNTQVIPEATLLQAITNTQIIDGFTIKRTKDHVDTVAYLTLMTRYLQSCFSSKVLRGCSYAEREKLETTRLSDFEHTFLTFEEFNTNCAKNKPPTITELFAKQLHQIPGLSADKVYAIVDLFRTPSSLISAYDNCTCQADAENLLACIKSGKSQRNLGPAISKVVYQLYNEEILT